MTYYCEDCQADLIQNHENEYECPICGGKLVFDGVSEIPTVETLNWGISTDDWDTEDDMPQCCISCGNGCYPDCQAGCNIYQNW